MLLYIAVHIFELPTKEDAMFNSYEELKKYCTDKGIRFIDFKIIDLVGRWHHLTVPLEGLTDEILEQGSGSTVPATGFSA